MTFASTIAQSLLAEFDVQAPITRRFLERLPDEHLLWKPHAKSMTAGQLAFHLATVPAGVVRFVQNNPAPAPTFQFAQPESSAAILQAHDQGVRTVHELLPTLDDTAMHEIWRMIAGDKEIAAVPRGQFLRNAMLNHWYQHRGQFSVYLRILQIPVPSSWGPSADETLPALRELQPA